MKPPSRRMPVAPVQKPSWLAWVFLAALITGLVYWIFRQPYVGLVILGLALLYWFQTTLEKRSRRRLAASRAGESICSFARSFDQKTDTWIIRAAYEELCRFLTIDSRPLPVRRQDHCERDLSIDPEDLGDLAVDIAFRARRSMDDSDE